MERHFIKRYTPEENKPDEYYILCSDPATGKNELIRFTDKTLFDEVRRSYWAADNNERKHAAEIPFSSLKGCIHGGCEHFRNADLMPASILEQYEEGERKKVLMRAISQLSPQEQALLEALYLNPNKMTQREYAEKCGVCQTTIRVQKDAIVNKLKTMLKTSF